MANAGYDEIYFNQATVLMQMGKIPEAIQYYRLCLAINPLSREVYNALTALYLKDIARYGAEAEQYYRHALELFPQDKDLWNNYGYLETQRGSMQEAFHAYSKALEIDPAFEMAKKNLEAIAAKLKSPLIHPSNC